MTWSRAGTVSVTQNSNAVIGTGTTFIADSRVGDAFIGPDGALYEVTNIASNTALAIAPAYRGVTFSSGAYALAPMQGYNKDTADALRLASLQVGDALSGLDDSVAEAAVSAATATAAKDVVLLSESTAVEAAAAAAASEAHVVSLATGVEEDAANSAIAAAEALASKEAAAISAASAAASAGSITNPLPIAGGTMSGALNLAPLVSIASSATPAIGAAAANTIAITGTTGITGFDSIASGAVRTLVFAGVLTLTHNATSLILPKGEDITTAAGDVLQFTSLGGGNWRCTGKMLATEGGAATGGIYVGVKLPWSLSEASIPGGTLPDNGQLVDRATWPELWALVSGQAISDATWIADPLQRGKYSTGNGTTTFRMPDTNGKHSDGLTPAAAVLRGHGKNSAGTPGAFQLDQLQNITGEFSLASNVGVYLNAVGTGPFAPSATNKGYGYAPGVSALADTRSITFDASRTARAGTETRATNVTVVWITVGATGVSNSGTVDVTALATNVNAQAAKTNDLEFGYVSSDLSWTNGGLVTVNHGMASKPSRVQIELVCAVAEGNYTVGTVIPIGGMSFSVVSPSGYGHGAYVTDTQILVHVISNGIYLWNATTSASFLATPANWRFRIKASKS